MTNTTIQTAVNEARDKFFSIGKKDRNLFMQLLIGLKYPLHHLMVLDEEEANNFKVYKKAYENKNKREFTKCPELYLIKRREKDDRIGTEWKQNSLKLRIENIIAMFYIIYEGKSIHLQDILDEFIEDKYPTMKKYCKTKGKNEDNFEEHRSAGKRKVTLAEDESKAYKAYWEGYRRHGPKRCGFETYPPSKTESSKISKSDFVPMNERKVMYVEFNPPVKTNEC